jgi:hypothetical protein
MLARISEFSGKIGYGVSDCILGCKRKTYKASEEPDHCPLLMRPTISSLVLRRPLPCLCNSLILLIEHQQHCFQCIAVIDLDRFIFSYVVFDLHPSDVLADVLAYGCIDLN